MGRYSSELVGEASYQDAVRRMRVGDPVDLLHEPDNKYDDLAVKALDASGRTLGYVPRDSWLQRVVAEDGTDVFAKVRAVIGGEAGKPLCGLVLDVFTAGDAERARAGNYRPDEPPAPAAAKASALGQIVEHRAPPRGDARLRVQKKSKGFFADMFDAIFRSDGEAQRMLEQARAEQWRGTVIPQGSDPSRPIYIKSGPNSFQSCMGCVGVVVMILLVLFMIPTPNS